MHCRQRPGKAFVRQACEDAALDQASRDNLSHDQNQQVIEQAVKRCLPSIAFGERLGEKEFACRGKRRVAGERYGHQFRKSLADWIAGLAAQIDGSAGQIGTPIGVHNEAVRALAREEQQRGLIELNISLAFAS